MMNCPNCGANVNQGGKFCGACGAKIVFESVQPNQMGPTPIYNQQFHTQNQYVSQQQPIMNNNVVNGVSNHSSYSNDDALINAYIGKNVDKLKNGGFSINTFFLGNIYVLYRKMWRLWSIWFVVSMIVSMLLSSWSLILNLVANIFISTQFKKWYLKDVKDNVAKIKEENPTASHEQLLMICKQKGGTTIIPIIIFGVLGIAIFAIMLFSGLVTLGNGNKDDDNYNNSSINDNISNLSFNIPSSFKKKSSTADNILMYSFGDYNSNDYCNITLYAINSYLYDSANAFLEDNAYYSDNDTVSSIEQKRINGNNWASLTVKKTYSTTYYYASENNDKMYVTEFNITKDSGKCSSAHKFIVNSFKFN